MGKIAEALLKDGVTLSVSSRGIGSLRDNVKSGYKEVGEDFMLATAADIVADPSALMLLFKASWRVKNGFGMEVSSAKTRSTNTNEN